MREDQEILVKVEGLSKKFCKDLKTSLYYGLQDLVTNISGNKKERLLRDKEFWALKDINFELRRGECLGLIGHNGAGKSTLLKILNGLIKPDAGRVTIKGKVGALIELGAGFNPILTGRENIYNNGAVLGFTRREIKEKIEEIIDFAEIREFIDMPVQNYSSGMQVRLGFAVAAQLEPDVLIIDEVLAVGDMGFRAKCYDRIGSLLGNTAIIIVSHSMPQVIRIASEIILLKNGRESFKGNKNIGLEKYYDQFTGPATRVDKNKNISEIEVIGVKEIYAYNEELEFSLNFNSTTIIDSIEVNIILLSREEIPIAQINSSINTQLFSLKKGTNIISLSTEKLRLNAGVYYISLTLFDTKSKKDLIWLDKIKKFKVKADFIGATPYIPYGKFKMIN